MFSRLFIAACGVLILMFMAVSLDDAEAKRMGGGRSFGGRTTMSKPAAPPASSAVKPQTATQQNQAAAMPRQGMFGGMGGMLGGLLAGGLLGSMLFGGGMGGFGGGMLDILLIGGLLYLLFKFLGRRRAAANAAGGMGAQRTAEATAGPGGNYQQYQARPSPGGMSWDALSSQPGGGSASATAGTAQVEDTRNIPAGFDENEFLEGAKAAYTRLNTAWDSRNLEDIARFATPAFMDEIRAQAAEDPDPSRTEIMLINASLVEVKEDEGEQMASVFFSVLLRESAEQAAPADVREMWHFVRNADGTGQWRLDGIQQVM